MSTDRYTTRNDAVESIIVAAIEAGGLDIASREGGLMGFCRSCVHNARRSGYTSEKEN